MKTEQITINKLVASEGWLTQATDTQSRIFTKEVILGKLDSEANWTEWTDAEKVAYEQEQEEKMQSEN